MSVAEYTSEVRLLKDGQTAPPPRKSEPVADRFLRAYAVADTAACELAVSGWPGKGDVTNGHIAAIRAHMALLEARIGKQAVRRFVALIAAGRDLCALWDGES